MLHVLHLHTYAKRELLSTAARQRTEFTDYMSARPHLRATMYELGARGKASSRRPAARGVRGNPCAGPGGRSPLHVGGLERGGRGTPTTPVHHPTLLLLFAPVGRQATRCCIPDLTLISLCLLRSFEPVVFWGLLPMRLASHSNRLFPLWYLLHSRHGLLCGAGPCCCSSYTS